MITLLKGLALGYAICGVMTALIYAALLPQARKASLLAHLPICVLIALSGPVTSWVMFWNMLSERLNMHDLRANFEEELPALVAHLAHSRARRDSTDSRAAEVFRPPLPNNRRWN